MPLSGNSPFWTNSNHERMIKFEKDEDLTYEEFILILTSSGLSSRRPMDRPDLLKGMLAHSNLLITAREEKKILGFLRALTDFSYRTFIADLAVLESRQGEGIGRRLIQAARNYAPESRLILFSAEQAEGFYQRIGFQLHERCYQLKAGEDLK